MSKRFISSLLMALFFVTAMGVFTSCKDYDDDIARLEEQLDANKKTFDQINSLITDGSVITKVEKVGNGIEVTLSNGQKYTITNGTDAIVWTIGEDGYWYQNGTKTEYYALGKDGTNGKDGKDAIQWTIGADGYWYQDGVKTNVKAEGTDGTNGAEWTIGTDGYWYKNGVKTNWKAVGKDGKDGTNVAGKDGKDGGYYRPNENGYFDFCDSEGRIIEPNAIKITSNAPNGITAVMDDGELKLYGVEGVDSYVTVALSNALRGFVFKPATYVDGVPAILMESLEYNPMSYTKGGKKVTDPDNSDVWAQDPNYVKGTKVSVVNPETEAYYHVNPKNAKFEDLKNIKFVVHANDDFYVTRKAPASTDFAVTAELDEDYGMQDGVIRVKVHVKGTPATGEKISVVALQTTKKNGEDVTSDYATIYKKDVYQGLRIAARINNDNLGYYKHVNGIKDDYHYRRYVAKNDIEAGIPNFMPVQNDKDTEKTIDLVMPYNKNKAIGVDNGVLNLNDFVMTHLLPKTCTAFDMERFGLSFDFSIVRYQVGRNATEEEEYINHGNRNDDGTYALTNGILQVSETYKSSALKRTPIVCVRLMHGTDVLEVAYIKVKIDDVTPITADDKYLTLQLSNIDFTCNNQLLAIDYKEMSKYVYRDMNMSKKQFHETYEFDNAYRPSAIIANEEAKSDPQITAGDGRTHTSVGNMSERASSGGDLSEEGTHVIEWLLSKNDLWNNKGTWIYQQARYKHRTIANTYVYVTFKVYINPFNPSLKVLADARIANYWTNTPETWYNVRTPLAGETNAAKCQLQANLNTPFRTTGTNETGYARYTLTGNGTVNMELAYRFSNVMTSEGYTIKNKNTAGVRTSELWKGNAHVATIYNKTSKTVDSQTFEQWIEVKKNEKVAQDLINSGNWKVKITLTGYACGDDDKAFDAQFFGDKNYYVALLMRPVFFEQSSTDPFQDGVDFGKEGSYIDVTKVLKPHDWRDVIQNYIANPTQNILTLPLRNNYSFEINQNYYQYYGPFSYEDVNSNDVEVDYGMASGNNWVKSGNWVKNEKFEVTTQMMGSPLVRCLTYKNNGNVLLHNAWLKVPFKVTYGWGTVTVYVEVPVKNTGNLAPRR